MEYLSLLLFISIAVPLAMMLFICTGRTRSLLIFIVIGLVVALFCGELNAIVIDALPFSYVFCVTNITPLIEEICKAVPILFFTIVYRPKRQQLLENAIAVGVGFAVLENAFVFAKSGASITLVTAVLRGFGAGLMHGICTLLIGLGLSYIHVRKKVFYSGSLALLSMAVLFHSLYNQLVSSGNEPIAFIITTSVVVIGSIVIKKKVNIGEK